MNQAGHFRIGAPMALEGAVFRNSALYQPVALARLVVGGAAHGQVLISQQPHLVMAVQRASQFHVFGGTVSMEPEERVVFSASEVEVGGRIYRTWMHPNHTPEEHFLRALTGLIDASSEAVESCRSV